MIDYTKTGKNRYIFFNLIEKTQVLKGIGNTNVIKLLRNKYGLADIHTNNMFKRILKRDSFLMMDYSGVIIGHPMSDNFPSYVVIDNTKSMDELLFALPTGLIRDVLPILKVIRRKNTIAKILDD